MEDFPMESAYFDSHYNQIIDIFYGYAIVVSLYKCITLEYYIFLPHFTCISCSLTQHNYVAFTNKMLILFIMLFIIKKNLRYSMII